MLKMKRCKSSGLIVPEKFIEEKNSLKKSIEHIVEKSINALDHVREDYFLTIHARFDKEDPETLLVKAPKATLKPPTFVSNTLVFYVSPIRGLHELIWTVPAAKKGERPAPIFNKSGVELLQKKDVLPKAG